jgi:ubiquinone/menaquinone biosynthesis C-methylase UbiE/uncharacterized protein YbaR (Trm112 family)
MLTELAIKEKGLVCQNCSGGKLSSTVNNSKQMLLCTKCKASYPVLDDTPLMYISSNSNESDIKQDIQVFWKDLYHNAYSEHESLNQHTLPDLIDKLKEMFFARNHLAVHEMPISELKDKKVLEVGCGAGAHSSLFCKEGAKITSLDLTVDRVIATKKKLEIIDKSNSSFVLQGDAENLPFEDNFFDIVYSNGVLHHTPNTQKSIEEVRRVLKPGGSAVIMLYAKHSYLYWINIFFLRGIILGNIFRHSNWLGRTTEWMSSSKQTIYNPETKVYSNKEILHLFSDFKSINVRKSSFVFQQLPFIGKIISFLLSKNSEINPAGKLVYGHEWRHETKFELYLGRYIGFNLNIIAKK